MKLSSKIYVAGHNGLVGSAIVRCLKNNGYTNIITRSHRELNLTNQKDTEDFFISEKPEFVFLAAAKVGGILANMNGHAEFLTENLKIQTNIIDCAYRYNVKKLLFLGSSCIYPKEAVQPIPESALLTGPFEPTNEGYAIAKVAGLKMCEYYNRQYGADFISVMPCNLYGYNDNFNPVNSHLLPALIRKFYEAVNSNADTVTVLGTGKVLREFLFSDNLASACEFVMNNYSKPEFLNVGYGEDFTVTQIAEMIKEVSGFKGKIIYDTSKPDGMYRKIMNSDKIRSLGWKPTVTLQEGIKLTYDWYTKNVDQIRK